MAWLDEFPLLAVADQETRRLLQTTAQSLALPAGAAVFGPGMAPQAFLLVRAGTVRVEQNSESGRSIVLYRVGAGESCPLTTVCLLGNDAYPADAITETDVQAIAVPRHAFDSLMARSAEFRRFVFSGFSDRLMDLFRVIEDVAFTRLDVRLAQKLLSLGGNDGIVPATHQDLAAELGSAREVISRQLHDFQQRGWVESGRGQIRLLNRPALQSLAAGHIRAM